MKPRTRVILEMAVEEGVRRGWQRAHKHVENPNEGSILAHLEECVMGQISEYFTYEEEDF